MTKLRGFPKTTPQFSNSFGDTSHLDKYFRNTRNLNTHVFVYTLYTVPSSPRTTQTLLIGTYTPFPSFYPIFHSSSSPLEKYCYSCWYIATVIHRNVVWAESEVSFACVCIHVGATLYLILKITLKRQIQMKQRLGDK